MKRDAKTIFCCQGCGFQTPKWLGRCPECGSWDSMVEEKQRRPHPASGKRYGAETPRKPVAIDQVEIDDDLRLLTGIGEFDRVLGGGLVAGSLVLIGGDPGIGKSTLMLQALHGLAASGHRVLYVSGEESIRQIKLRSRRLNTVNADLLVLAEVDLEPILETAGDIKPDVLVIDSIQTMYSGELTSAPGSVSQVRESTMKLMIMAKKTGIPVFLVGHVTKDGAIAGPRIMEHMVDTVLYFEGDRNHVFRILRAVKNRFGSTNEIGVFEMQDHGLQEVTNPSAIFLHERPENTAGSVVSACMEGTRPVLVELQGLAGSATFGTPRRTILGLDPNRVSLLIAVMEKKLGMHLMGYDIFMNVAGGVKVDEPAVDLGIIAAVASSFLDRPTPEGTVVMGEVGLTGEIRAISHAQTRLGEVRKMGFTRCLLPAGNMKHLKSMKGFDVIGCNTIADAMERLF